MWHWRSLTSAAKTLWLASVLFISVAPPLWSNSGESSSSVLEIQVPTIQKLTINRGFRAFPAATAEDFAAGYLQFNRVVRLRVWSNGPWTLSMRAEEPTLGTLGERDKPVAELLWRTRNNQPFSPLSTSDQVIASGNRPVKRKGVRIDMRVLLDWDLDGPGTYEADLIVTLGAPL